MSSDTPTPALRAQGLRKSYGTTEALSGLDLEVAPGEVHGLLGPNGAGKTTTIRILLGLLRHDGGEVSVLGEDPWSEAVSLHRRLAYVPGDVELWPNLTGGEAIDLLTDLRGGIDVPRRDQLMKRFDLDPTKKGRTYSKGNRQKVAIVAALASDAELFILDEPTAGLDPLMEAVFKDEVRRLKSDGRTVLLSSHLLAQVEELCDRISIIRRGEVVEAGTMTELRHLTRTTVTAETAAPVEDIGSLPGVHDLDQNGSRVRFDVDGKHLDEVVRHLAGFGVSALTSHPPTLEQILLRHYDDELGEISESVR